MKRCPTCNRTETDDSLAFCRSDGTALMTEAPAADRDAPTVLLPSTGPTTVLPPAQTEPQTRHFSKPKRRWVALVLLALVVVCAAAAFFYFSRKASASIQSIAVMPFVNETGNSEVEYLSDGITESLIGSLSQLPNLSVKARSSVFRYKGKAANPQTIGSELSVQAILNGRVTQHGDQLMLGLELIDARTENVIWSHQYNRRPADVVTLQSEIARDVSGRLQSKLSGLTQTKLAKTYTTNPDAYQNYLKGRFHWNKRTPHDLQRAVEYFQQAIALDPNYALAFAGLADGYTLLAAFGGAPAREVMPKAREAALKALALDAQLSEPYVALGHIAEYYDYDFVRAEQHFRKAIEINPNYATAHEFLGTLLSNLGRDAEAEAALKRALELEPLNLGTNRMYGEGLFFSRKYDQSIAQLKKTIDLDSTFSSAHRSLARVYLVTQNYAGHVEAHARHFELIGEPKTAAVMRKSFAEGGWQGYLRAMTGPDRPQRFFFPFYVATYMAELGENDRAFAELDKTYEERFYYVAWMKRDPCLDRLRSDPKFNEMLKRMNLSD